MKLILINLPMPIITPRLLIRPPQIGDGIAINSAILESFDVLHKFVNWAHKKPSIEETEEHIRLAAANWILKKNEEPWLELFIFDRTSGDVIGCTGFHNINWEIPCVETGYWIRNSRSGKGLMTEAINAITHYAFLELHVRRIEIRCDILNDRSKKIPERLGYHLEATLKNHRMNRSTNSISDTLIYVKYDLGNIPQLSINWNH